uniref:Uncharacterized protein n=1 Tax=viral metagenome TaxID=1070528 RepID=A0A6C0KH63_9ZZZZ
MTEKIVTTNARIVSFYNNNPHLNFDAVNLIFIDLFDKLHSENIMGTTVQGQMLMMMNQLHDSFAQFKSTVGNDLTNNVMVKLADIRKDYIEDVKTIMQNNQVEKLGPLLEKNNHLLMDKTAIMMNDILPRSQGPIQDVLKNFQKSIIDETSALLKHADTGSVKDLIHNFEIKAANMQQPIYAFIASSEERIQNNINCLKDITNGKNNGLTAMDDQPLIRILSQQYNTADIVSVSNNIPHTNLLMMKRQYKQNILIHSMTSDRNIASEDTKQFAQLIDEHRCNGIFISQKSGIASKPNYHIDIQHGCVLVYIHHFQDSPCKINIAIDIIDNLSSKIKLMSHSGSCGDNSIPKEVLEEINKDYQHFVMQKDTMISLFKESNKKILAQLEDMKFVALDKYLSTKFSPSAIKPGLKCELCKQFNAHNLKALAAHKRGCLRKNVAVSDDKENVVINC